ncbi:MAG: REDY-like protein HapK [Actinobacteria bacterium]|nr:REDY-like protein HapK [Actinomycetota bacterium]MCA1739959.1 REDY-like protein HapK [Actinomycetota bacterium]
MTTMIVLVNLKTGVSLEDYERWVTESYAPTVKELPAVTEWRNHRVSGLLGSDAVPPHQYVVTVEVNEMEQLSEGTWPVRRRRGF